MHGEVAEGDYCGLYKSGLPYHWVVVWEEFCCWFERIGGERIPFPVDDWVTRAKVVSAFFRRVFVECALPEVSTCTVKVGLCTQGPEHLHVFLENVVLKEVANNG